VKCPRCKKDGTLVRDSRENHEKTFVRRRRGCKSCGFSFTTYEAFDNKILIRKSIRSKIIFIIQQLNDLDIYNDLDMV
jgi:transcriptional regulator NrdR family protein